jgi:hypothetical protein
MNWMLDEVQQLKRVDVKQETRNRNETEHKENMCTF